MANLEGARCGFAFASGSIATATVMHMLASGDHVVCCDDMYGGTYRQFEQVFTDFGLQFTYVDLSEPAALERALLPNTKMVWLESPSNPMMKLVDIAALSAIAHANGAFVVVDNTFLSPYFQRPIELGADVVVHSTTKYINGHSDLVGGLVVTDDEALAERVGFLSNAMGGVQATFDAYLCLRSVKTLAVRMQAHERNAFAVAEFLNAHPKVGQVLYPGLPDFPQHELACRQTTGHGGTLSFAIDAELAGVKRFLERVEIFTLAESLGGVESLIEHPAIMTHASIPLALREALGITDALVRVSVGIESSDDLLRDLDQALAAVTDR